MSLDRHLGIIVDAQDLASGKLAKVKAEVAGIGQAGGTMGSKLGGAFKTLETGAGRIGGAFNHAKGAIGGLLSGPLGVLGLGAGILSVGGALNNGIAKAQGWGLQIEKLQGITHGTAEELSGLLAVTEKYGLSNERLAQIAGFTEKTLGNLEKGLTDTGQALAGVKGPSDAVAAAQERLQVATLRLTEAEANRKTKLSTLVAAQNGVADAQRALTKAQSEGGAAVGGADKFLKDYGFDIRDSGGKVKDFNTLLLTFTDYWNGNTAQGLKAAAAAKLFGRGYADLVPILNLGSQGIKDAEEEAKALGLTLTQDNVRDLAKAREATRQWGDALGGLELQIGLGLLPRLTELATWATEFVGSHRDQIVGFFKDAGTFASKAAGDIGQLAGAAGAFWNAIPGPLRDLIVKGYIADRTVKFLFGFDAPAAIGKALFGGSFFARGSSPANPMYVSGGGMGVAGAGGGVGLLTMALTAATIDLLVVGLGQAVADAIGATPQNPVDSASRSYYRNPASPGYTPPTPPAHIPGGAGGSFGAPTPIGRNPDYTSPWDKPNTLSDDARENNRILRVTDPALNSSIGKLATVASHWGYTQAEWQAIYARAMIAGGRSQINALARSHDKLNAIALADSEVSKMMTGAAGPFFRDSKNMGRELASLVTAQKYFNAHGDTATAAKLGADIKLLEGKMHADVTVNVSATTYVSVRDQQTKTRSAVSTGQVKGVS